MLYITGDTHRTLDSQKLYNNDLSEKDYLIVAGDFGYLWGNEGTLKRQEDNFLLDRLNKLPYTILFIDGNHENFDVLETYKYSRMFGGRVQVIRQKVIHLCRGEIYNIDKTKILTMGGAVSIDKDMRTEHISWWRQEVPNYNEYANALRNLEKNKGTVDYVITHCAPSCWLGYLNSAYRTDEVTNDLENLFREVKFIKWYCGHYHIDKGTYNFRCLYNDIIKIGE